MYNTEIKKYSFSGYLMRRLYHRKSFPSEWSLCRNSSYILITIHSAACEIFPHDKRIRCTETGDFSQTYRVHIFQLNGELCWWIGTRKNVVVRSFRLYSRTFWTVKVDPKYAEILFACVSFDPFKAQFGGWERRCSKTF